MKILQLLRSVVILICVITFFVTSDPTYKAGSLVLAFFLTFPALMLAIIFGAILGWKLNDIENWFGSKG